MTDRIDLDEMSDDSGDEEGDAVADSIWRDAPADPGGQAAERGERATDGASGGPDEVGEASGGPDGANGGRGGASEDTDGASESAPAPDGRTRMPHVPQSGGRPAGIPGDGGVGTGGAGGSDGTGGTSGSDGPDAGDAGADGTADGARGPHGGGADDMTMALTYRAANRLADPAAVVADAAAWADWIGLVGDVPAHVVNGFQREHGVDVDFFSGAEAPGERLARIDRHSMFYAERMVVVGVEGEDESVAEAAGWEFVPLATAAENAGWRVTD